MKKHKPLKIILSIIGIILALIIVFAGSFLIYASVSALHVKDNEAMEIHGSAELEIDTSKPLRLLTWNIGYGALDEREDCYWDGGVNIYGESEQTVLENINALKDTVKEKVSPRNEG